MVHSPEVIAKAILVSYCPDHPRYEKAEKILKSVDENVVQLIKEHLFRRGYLLRNIATGVISLSERGELRIREEAP